MSTQLLVGVNQSKGIFYNCHFNCFLINPIAGNDVEFSHSANNSIINISVSNKISGMIKFNLSILPTNETERSTRWERQANVIFTARNVAGRSLNERFDSIEFSSEENSIEYSIPVQYMCHEKFSFEYLVDVREFATFRNLGNTCYFNALMQLLFHCCQYRNYVKQTDDVFVNQLFMDMERRKIAIDVTDFMESFPWPSQFVWQQQNDVLVIFFCFYLF